MESVRHAAWKSHSSNGLALKVGRVDDDQVAAVPDRVVDVGQIPSGEFVPVRIGGSKHSLSRSTGRGSGAERMLFSGAAFELKAFPSEKHFANWLGLCPTNETSGGKVLNRRTPKVVNRAKVAFRQAASTLIRSQSYLGAQYRRLRTRLGAPKAITAMARKLACLFYRLLQRGQQYVDKGMEYYEQRYRDQQVRFIVQRAKQLGLQIVTPATSNN